MRRVLYCLLLPALLLLSSGAGAQIVNRLKVDDETFQRYAWGRMQQFNPDNLQLADSLYRVSVEQQNFRYRCLALSLEFPVRFALGEYERMDEAVGEIKRMLEKRKDTRAFYYPVIHEYCQFLIHIGRASDAMLEARAMERIAGEEKSALGKMYAHRIVGLIQSYRTNSYLAIQNFTKAAGYCKEARSEQELPNLYILIAQEHIKMREFGKAEEYCVKAEEYEQFFPSLRTKTQMTRAYLYNAKEDWKAFWKTYDALVSDPLYKVQADNDSRYEMDVAYLQSKGLLEEALSKADSLGTARMRHALKHGIYAAGGSFEPDGGERLHLHQSTERRYGHPRRRNEQCPAPPGGRKADAPEPEHHPYRIPGDVCDCVFRHPVLPVAAEAEPRRNEAEKQPDAPGAPRVPGSPGLQGGRELLPYPDAPKPNHEHSYRL